MFYTTWSLRAWFQFRWTIEWSKFQQNPCKLRVWKYPPFEYCVFHNREKPKVCYLSIWWIFQSHSSLSPSSFFSLIFFYPYFLSLSSLLPFLSPIIPLCLSPSFLRSFFPSILPCLFFFLLLTLKTYDFWKRRMFSPAVRQHRTVW